MSVKLGLACRLDAPAVVEMAGWAGFDFVWLDAEHGQLTRVSELVRAADAAGVEAWFRVPSNEPQVISAYLQLGAAAVMVPHVDDEAAARRAVLAAKYGPLGRRNWFPSGRDARWGLIPAAEYPAAANARVKLIVQAETPEAVANAPSLLALDGVDMICTGPGDLAQCLGFTGQPSHPAVRAAEEAVFAAAARAGKPVLHFASSGAELRALRARWGVEYVVAGNDDALALGALRARLAEMRG